MVPPHGLQKLKVAPYQFLRLRFTRIIMPVNGMCPQQIIQNDCLLIKSLLKVSRLLLTPLHGPLGVDTLYNLEL